MPVKIDRGLVDVTDRVLGIPFVYQEFKRGCDRAESRGHTVTHLPYGAKGDGGVYVRRKVDGEWRLFGRSRFKR